MVKAASGFLTKDGRFFETKEAAELNEAEESLVGYYEDVSAQFNKDTNKFTPIADDFLRLVNQLSDPLFRYIVAVKNAISKATEGHERSQRVSPTEGHERSSEQTTSQRSKDRKSKSTSTVVEGRTNG